MQRRAGAEQARLPRFATPDSCLQGLTIRIGSHRSVSPRACATKQKVALLPRPLVHREPVSTLRNDLATGHEVATLRGHTHLVNACPVMPDGRRVVSALHDQTLRVWGLVTRHEVATLHGYAAG
jgi:hypothetical protein